MGEIVAILPSLAPPRTILVIEDDADIRDSLRELLEMENYRVIEACHGEEALQIIEAGHAAGDRIDLALLDYRMPTMGGQEFLARRDGQPTALAIPVVVMTASSMNEIRAEQAVAIISKPLDVSQVLSAISRVLKS